LCWVSWVRLDGRDGRLFGRELGGERYRAGCVRPDLTGRTDERSNKFRVPQTRSENINVISFNCQV